MLEWLCISTIALYSVVVAFLIRTGSLHYHSALDPRLHLAARVKLVCAAAIRGEFIGIFHGQRLLSHIIKLRKLSGSDPSKIGAN